MEPTSWGIYGWGFIHNVALGYPKEQTYMIKENYRQFFHLIGDVIPCKSCSTHYKKMIADYPPDLVDRDSLFKWTVDIHNKVNKRLGKSEISYNDAYNIWLKNTNKTLITEEYSSYYLYLLFITVIIICTVSFIQMKRTHHR